ncbi:hypothetical protein Q9292_09800 [Methylophilus sp. VKM B-3414]|uniref:hypothetical protein n=1 Tax=Methylophilus sp. VKM B-3414 TaxID=3076121 RepID=UPI0028C6576E|nr:hypothetical protein [Methylophilus sp. VKM B-3414]MDT7849904.1 hypothetical protein [Methylophilus sp. VKM B-3414]
MIFANISWQTKLIAIAALCIASFATGWRVHGWKTKADLTHTIAKAEKTRQSDEGQQANIVTDKQDAQAEVKIIYRTIREKIHDQNDQSVCFTAESLQLWNAAIGANTDLHRRKPAGEAEAADTAERQQGQTGRDLVATVTDTLTNATDNFEICTDNSVKHLALIERVRSLQGKMCYCSQ